MKLLYLVICMAIGCSSSGNSAVSDSSAVKETSTDTETLISFQDRITVPYLRTHLSVLAADSMEGRETGTRGQIMAAEYLAEQYKSMGLKPVGDNDTYYQNFDLSATKRDSTVFKTYKMEDGQKVLIERSVESLDKIASYIRSYGGSDSLSGEIVFAGFGVNDPANNVAHLEGMDLSGKWVMIFEEIPHFSDGDTLIDPAIDGRRRLASIVEQKGAEGLLLIRDMSRTEFQDLARRIQPIYNNPSSMTLDYLNRGSQGGFSKGYTVINPEMAARILDLTESKDLASLKTNLIDTITEFSPVETGYALSQTPYTSKPKLATENVLALLEGGDPELKDEVVVLTSHYDHVGIGRPDSTGDRIYNGADDDGSGTVAILNIAKALTEAKENGYLPRRSILFLNVTGEEKGLLGSRYYSDHPVIPIEKTVANINTDMIGRIDARHEKMGQENYSYIIGGKIISSQLDSLLEVANKQSGNIELSSRYNDLEDPNHFYRRSDHWNFGRLGVPFVFFFTGVHEDYHKPGDEVHKIRFEKMARIAKTMYATTILLANNDKAPEVDNQEFIEITRE
ncbi:M28 family peptidase [Balneolaceae bacterium YR4-1]|uniref:M28 family peptidase n=1 Tax=Halalkalibaculum roseum TaxID=2709311 RepID=A0A6M1T541_9BACT|nr:M28 family peptidase [Halalkalibaculum roseum]NGP77927.1 M28 family peptidase [Halalkalibaculum roseum]